MKYVGGLEIDDLVDDFREYFPLTTEMEVDWRYFWTVRMAK